MATLLPSTNPASFRPCRKGSTVYAKPVAGVLLRNPTTGIAGCCARAASGHPAAAAPPRSVMNSRRFIRSPLRHNTRDSPNGLYGKSSRSSAETSSLRLDVGRPDHLAPLLCFFADELAEVGGRARKRPCTQIGEPCLYLGFGKSHVYLLVQFVD